MIILVVWDIFTANMYSALRCMFDKFDYIKIRLFLKLLTFVQDKTVFLIPVYENS